MSTRLLIIVGLIAVALAVGIAAIPKAETPADRVARLASELRCPVCQGLSVEDSPSDTAREMRVLIARRVQEGRTDAQIRAEFRAAYGDWIFLSPPLLSPRGVIWLVPLAVIAVGLALIGARLRRAAPTAAPTAAQLSVLHERLRQEGHLD